MRSFPRVPGVDDAPASLFDGGHLWVQEWVVGAPLSFQLEESGLLAFGTDEGQFEPGEIPVGYREAVEHVRASFDREQFRAAVEDVESVTFHGVATRFEGVIYDWASLPPFVGLFVRDDDRDQFLPPDAVEQLFERLGLAPVNAVEKEVRAADFDPDSYELPASAWRAGPAAGVLIRDKTGGRAKLEREPGGDTAEFDGEAADAASEFATRERLTQTSERLGGEASLDAVVDTLVAAVAREQYARLFDDGVDPAAFRSAVAERASRVLGAD